MRIFANFLLAAVLPLGLTACGSGTPGTLQSIVISAPSATLAVGASEQFTATGYYGEPNGIWTPQDITGSVAWSSTNPAAAAISSTGLATGVAAGATNITAVGGNIKSIYALTVK